MTHHLSPLVRAVIEKAANAAESAIVNVCRKDPMPTAGRVMEAVDAAIRALDADQPAAELAHLVPGVAEVERLRAAGSLLSDALAWIQEHRSLCDIPSLEGEWDERMKAALNAWDDLTPAAAKETRHDR